MNDFSWYEVYRTDLQAVWALLVVPIGFLAYRIVVTPNEETAAVPAAARFVSLFTIIFAVETMIDPLSTGPLLEAVSSGEDGLASAIPFLFVYLGDFRVLLLLAVVVHPDRGLRAALGWSLLATLIIPIVAGGLFAIAGLIWADVHSQVLWMLYEFGFFLLCVVLARHWLPREIRGSGLPQSEAQIDFARSLLGFSAAYYSLWLFADLVIVVGGLDLGWALRIVPNQLYYALWIPFVYVRFFAPPVRAAALRR